MKLSSNNTISITSKESHYPNEIINSSPQTYIIAKDRLFIQWEMLGPLSGPHNFNVYRMAIESEYQYQLVIL